MTKPRSSNEVYKDIREIFKSKKYLFERSHPNITACFTRYVPTISKDNDLVEFNSCLTNSSCSLTLSDYRYLSDILILTDVGSVQNIRLSTNSTQTLAQIIGINTTLTTLNTTNLVCAINSLNSNKFDTAGDGLTSSGTVISVKITTTTDKGGLEIDSTDHGLGIKLTATNSGLALSTNALAVNLA